MVETTKKYAGLYGRTTPTIKDVQNLDGAGPNEPCSVMQIDLCGGVFGRHDTIDECGCRRTCLDDAGYYHFVPHSFRSPIPYQLNKWSEQICGAVNRY